MTRLNWNRRRRVYEPPDLVRRLQYRRDWAAERIIAAAGEPPMLLSIDMNKALRSEPSEADRPKAKITLAPLPWNRKPAQ